MAKTDNAVIDENVNSSQPENVLSTSGTSEFKAKQEADPTLTALRSQADMYAVSYPHLTLPTKA